MLFYFKARPGIMDTLSLETILLKFKDKKKHTHSYTEKSPPDGRDGGGVIISPLAQPQIRPHNTALRHDVQHARQPTQPCADSAHVVPVDPPGDLWCWIIILLMYC